MTRRKARRAFIPKEIGEILIDLFGEKTKLPIILFEEGIEDPRFIETSTRHFSDFCKYLHDCGYKYRCSTDHFKRASECYAQAITLCWIGLSNVAAPIFVDSERKAVLLYGQKKLNDPEIIEKSNSLFDEAILTLNVNETQRKRLKEKFEAIPLIEKEQIDPKHLHDFKKLSNWLFSVISEKLIFEKNVKQVSHELSINLQGAIADAEIHFMEIDPSLIENRESAKNLLNALERMNVVVQNFGKYLGEYQFKIYPLKDILDKCIDIYISLAESKLININLYKLDSSPFPKIKASKRHLELAFNNLIHNAIKYSHRGFHRGVLKHMTIDIFGERIGDDYILKIQNFGVGILPDEIKLGKIFEGGYKGKLTEKEYRTGGGYGLSITKEIIEKHNATFNIESEKKGGETYVTTVTITFRKVIKE